MLEDLIEESAKYIASRSEEVSPLSLSLSLHSLCSVPLILSLSLCIRVEILLIERDEMTDISFYLFNN